MLQAFFGQQYPGYKMSANSTITFLISVSTVLYFGWIRKTSMCCIEADCIFHVLNQCCCTPWQQKFLSVMHKIRRMRRKLFTFDRKHIHHYSQVFFLSDIVSQLNSFVFSKITAVHLCTILWNYQVVIRYIFGFFIDIAK